MPERWRNLALLFVVRTTMARVLTARTGTLGIGIFWTMFYLIVVTAPWVGGYLSAAMGSATGTFDFGIALLVLACVFYAVFTRLAVRIATA